MAITRVTAVWTGFPGAPGYSNFFFSAFGGGDLVDLEVERVRSFFTNLGSAVPSSVTVQVQQEAAILDDDDGSLISYALATDNPSPVEFVGDSDYSGASGAAVTWNTETVNRGRRVRGRTFVVPLSIQAYDSDGTLSSSALNSLNAAGEALIGDGDGPQFVVWSRPQGGGGGVAAPVVSHRVADRVAVLRSRRD